MKNLVRNFKPTTCCFMHCTIRMGKIREGEREREREREREIERQTYRQTMRDREKINTYRDS